jgi:UDP-N-acetylglucosamine acyltransferase
MKDQENFIHPTSIVASNVEMGVGNRIGPFCVLEGPLSLGDNNLIGPHVVIGTPGQDVRNPRYDSSERGISIGSNNIIREFTAIQKPAYTERDTRLGDGIYLMQGVHIPHDAIVEDGVTMTPNVALAGMTWVMNDANLGIGVRVAQYIVIGAYAMVAMGSPVVKNIKPLSKYIPGKTVSVNDYMIEKHGLEDFRKEIEEFVMEDRPPQSPRLADIVVRYEEAKAQNELGEY